MRTAVASTTALVYGASVRETSPVKIEDILVPVDFGPSSLNAISYATKLMDGNGEMHLLHVVDAEFVERAQGHGLGDKDRLTRQLYDQAEEDLGQLARQHASETLTIQPVVVVGSPFMEIVRLAKDLDFQMIVMGTHGQHLETIEQALFGSTAERVLRAANLPVVCVPYIPSPPPPETDSPAKEGSSQ